VYSLKQDVSLEKSAANRKAVECCQLRRKLHAKNSSVPQQTQTDSVESGQCTSASSQTEQQFDCQGSAFGLDSRLVTFTAANVEVEIPAGLLTAAGKLDRHYQHELGTMGAEILSLKSGLKTTVEFAVEGQTIDIPRAFEPYAVQLDILYTTAVRAAVAEVGVGDGWVQLGDEEMVTIGKWSCKLHKGVQPYVMATLNTLSEAIQETLGMCANMGHDSQVVVTTLQSLTAQLKEDNEKLLEQVKELQDRNAQMVEGDKQLNTLQAKLKVAHNIIKSLKLENTGLLSRISDCV
jgi:hypothetical protein